jgi:hypothetical protein
MFGLHEVYYFSIIFFYRIKPEIGYSELCENSIKNLNSTENEKYVQNWPSNGVVEFKKFAV